MPSSVIDRSKPSIPSPYDVVPADDDVPSKIKSACASVAGGRDYNEDRCFRCDAKQLYLVVDGMGGHRGGALASQIAVETVPARWSRYVIETRISHCGLETAFRRAVYDAVSEMNTVGRSHPEYDRMGCTLGAAFVIGDRLYFANVGDCRVYLLHGGKLNRLTKDQTLVQSLVDSRVISAKEARTHRWRHIVTNSVNAQGLQEEPRLQVAQCLPGDRVLVTSDGLTDELTDLEIKKIMSRCADPANCVAKLIGTALDRNARDNVSCVVFEL